MLTSYREGNISNQATTRSDPPTTQGGRPNRRVWLMRVLLSRCLPSVRVKRLSLCSVTAATSLFLLLSCTREEKARVSHLLGILHVRVPLPEARRGLPPYPSKAIPLEHRRALLLLLHPKQCSCRCRCPIETFCFPRLFQRYN